MTEPDHSNEKDADAGAPVPLHLEYFAAAEPDRRRARRVMGFSVLLAAGWAPYLCGVLMAQVVAHSWSGPVIVSHRFGAGLFLGAGVLASVAALIGFVRLRHLSGILAAALVVTLQLAFIACVGLAGR